MIDEMEISSLDENASSPPVPNTSVEVIDFFDAYNALCASKNYTPVSSLTKSLQTAIDGGPIPNLLNLKGTIKEIRNHRIDDIYLEGLIKPLSNSTFIRELNLSFNEIGDDGAIKIASYLKNDISLEILLLNSNNIGGTGIVAIAKALIINENLTVINLAYNKFSDEAGMEMASMLQINRRLQDLDISGCGLKARPLIAFATVLQNNDVLRSINFSDNRSNFSTLSQSLQNDVIMHISRMIKLNTHLQCIGLSKLGITDWATLDMLSKAIPSSTVLRTLDLSCNKISRDGGVAICKALHNHSTIRTLKLSCCSILDEGADAIGDMLLNNQGLNSLHLDHNGITGIGLESIANGIRGNKSLMQLTLWGNKWDVQACEAFSIIIGGVVSESNIGNLADVLPVILQAENLKRLQVPKHIIHSSEFENIKRPMTSSRLNCNQVDFVIYSVEGVLNIGHQILVK